MDECPSGLRSTPRKRVRVTPSASSNLASSASRVSSDWLEALFVCVCVFLPAFVSFRPILFPKSPNTYTISGKCSCFRFFLPAFVVIFAKKGNKRGIVGVVLVGCRRVACVGCVEC